ncbi:amino acid ABC transporter ATP-binding protein [Catellatospora citrea]|uniref:ABC transporter ATP-binding protein n=1 Tax=Catellatospora citrea TaxID=53366 RepID=A0A8J3P697_9ACTN|nr:amino acid ABC transporter ATP-binding protein [Catellatospora citrea]RKE10586.1 amino acid ABC transporter ATP-binding protein (PAAT family) [Catellatospora citrea]GIG03206.1 ABC transporter ATP-binding protein [Catellatospora citrea]
MTISASTSTSVSMGVRDITLAFGANQVLRGVNLDVPRGTTTCVIGPSGSGKSTLLRTINRLIEPDHGDVLLDGRSVLGDNPDQLRQRVGMVFQQFNLFPHMSVLRNVTLALRRIRKIPEDQAAALARHELDRVGLAAKAEARPAQLSGGQQQRVAIARALALQPQVMLFDEATSALDPELVKGVLSLMADLSAGGMTMLVVTHEMGFAREVADRVAFMDHGVVLEAAPPEAIFEAPEHPRLRQFLSQVF